MCLGIHDTSWFFGCDRVCSWLIKSPFVPLSKDGKFWIFCKHLTLFNLVQLRVRVANELGAGNAKGAKFATAVSVLNTLLVGFIFWLIIVIFNEKLALIFTSSSSVIQMVNELSILLAFTILLNCIQPVLSGWYLTSTQLECQFSKRFMIQFLMLSLPLCWYLLVFRGSNWIWSASSSGLYKHWQLLLGWNTSWASPRLVATFGYHGKCITTQLGVDKN